MSFFYLFILVALVVGLLAKVAIKPELIFEFPYFIAAVFAVFILPQAYSLAQFPGGVGHDDVEATLLMCNLILVAAAVGYSASSSKSTNKLFSQPIDPSRLFIAGAGLIAVGLAATILMPKSEARMAERGGLTGILTIYYFFAGLSMPGCAICLRLLRDRFTKERLLATVLGALTPIYSIVFAGRREVAVTFALMIGLSAYYNNKKRPSRVVIFGSLCFAMIAIPATGTYRGLMGEGRSDLVMQMRPVENFVNFFTKESTLELRNAAALINSTRLRDTFGWGRGYWNQIVFRFVPAQILSREFKDSLMLGATSKNIYATMLLNNYEISPGSTNTGIGDAYEQFGYFGCLFFFILARFFKTIWVSTHASHAIFLQVFYIMICSSAMRTVTHQTVDFLPGMIYQGIFLGTCYHYARIPERVLQLREQVRIRAGRQR